jgi:hypothetical protein
METEAWKHFNELLLKCPHHNVSQEDQVLAFYEGLNDVNNSLVYLACGDMLMEKTNEEAVELFENLCENSQQFSSIGRQGLKEKGIHEENTNGGVQTQMATMERKLDMLVKTMTGHNISHVRQIAQVGVCAICSHLDHITETCPMSSIIYQELKKNDLEGSIT